MCCGSGNDDDYDKKDISLMDLETTPKLSRSVSNHEEQKYKLRHTLSYKLLEDYNDNLKKSKTLRH